MLIFVGLGNPGSKYSKNRHNVGYMALDAIASDHGFSPWRKKFQAELAEGNIGGQKIMLIKPLSFMNQSGQPIGEVLRYYKCESTDMSVFYDEIDLEAGKIRLKDGGGHAGHNGIRSIFNHIGPHFRRIRIGVGHPGRKERVAGWVLSDFSVQDQAWLKEKLGAISTNIAKLVNRDDGMFLNAVATPATGQSDNTTRVPQTRKEKSAPQTSKEKRNSFKELLSKLWQR